MCVCQNAISGCLHATYFVQDGLTILTLQDAFPKHDVTGQFSALPVAEEAGHPGLDLLLLLNPWFHSPLDL